MLKSVAISNFKSLRHVDVQLEPVTILIGRSGTGKTNFIDAIRLLRQTLVTSDTSFSGFGGWAKVASIRAGGKDPVEFRIVFDIPGVPQDFTYRLTLVQHEPRIRHEELSHGDRTLYCICDGKWQTKPAVPVGENPFVPALPTLAAEPSIKLAYLFLTRGIGCYSFRGNVLLNRAENTKGVFGLADDGSNFLEVINNLNTDLGRLSDLEQVLSVLQVLNGAVCGMMLQLPQGNALEISYRLSDNVIVPLTIDQQSEGFRRLLAYLLAIYQQPPKQALLFDEPEQGIYPGALSALAAELKAAPSADRGQVIFTTHSPQLLDEFREQSLRVVELSNQETRIRPISRAQSEAVRESLLTTGDLLTVQEAHSDEAAEVAL